MIICNYIIQDPGLSIIITESVPLLRVCSLLLYIFTIATESLGIKVRSTSHHNIEIESMVTETVSVV